MNRRDADSSIDHHTAASSSCLACGDTKIDCPTCGYGMDSAATCKHGYSVEGDELARACAAGETEALCAQRPMPDESSAASTPSGAEHARASASSGAEPDAPAGGAGASSAASPSPRYGSIVADPPWELPYRARYGKGGRRGRKTKIPYSFMSVEEIMALPVADLADENAHLYLWSTRRNFREGIAVRVARAWGFEPRGELIWGLRNGGPGGVLGNGHEPILIASRGDLPFPKGMPVSVVFWKQPYHTGGGGKIHSAKPAGLQDLVEQMSPGPYLEMFSRNARLGWDTWGDEALHGTELIA